MTNQKLTKMVFTIIVKDINLNCIHIAYFHITTHDEILINEIITTRIST